MALFSQSFKWTFKEVFPFTLPWHVKHLLKDKTFEFRIYNVGIKWSNESVPVFKHDVAGNEVFGHLVMENFRPYTENKRHVCSRFELSTVLLNL